MQSQHREFVSWEEGKRWTGEPFNEIFSELGWVVNTDAT